MARRKEPRIPDGILDQLLGGADPKTAFNPNGLLDDLKKALAELPDGARWREWLCRVEAAIFASPTPAPREALARLVG